MNVGKIAYAPDYGRLHWDSIARKYVEHDTLPQTTFAPLEQALPDIVRQEDPALASRMAVDADLTGVRWAGTMRSEVWSEMATIRAAVHSHDSNRPWLRATRESPGMDRWQNLTPEERAGLAEHDQRFRSSQYAQFAAGLISIDTMRDRISALGSIEPHPDFLAKFKEASLVIIDPLQDHVANDNRKDRGPYIAVYRGRFYPFDPRASEVDIETIAHQLAAIVRYGGGTEKPYSVAEHSVHIARWLRPRYGDRTALYGLLHDAPEALSGFGDVQRPSKDRVPQIRAIEEKIWHAVAAAFGLSPMIPVEVHDADNRIIADEMAQGMWESDPLYRNPLGIELQFWDPGRAEIYFLDTFRKLTRGERLVA